MQVSSPLVSKLLPNILSWWSELNMLEKRLMSSLQNVPGGLQVGILPNENTLLARVCDNMLAFFVQGMTVIGEHSNKQ